MTHPRRIQRRRTKGWRLPEGAICVDRSTLYGNPFDWRLLGRELAVDMFRDMMNGFFDPFKLKYLTDDEFRRVHDAKEKWLKRFGYGAEILIGVRAELRGHDLACWCKLDAPCHADVLLEVANGRT